MNDGIGLLGVGLIGFGISTRYGWDAACIIVGGIFLSIAIIGAMRK
jgi:hypothetical protein